MKKTTREPFCLGPPRRRKWLASTDTPLVTKRLFSRERPSNHMLRIDLHTHTINSRCGHHTLWEVITFARQNGIRLLAITDHGPAQNATIRGTFFQDKRVPHQWDGLQILKGLEGNLMNDAGDIDLDAALLEKLDIVLVGMHPLGIKDGGIEANTRALANMIAREPAVDLITHPDISTYPLDFEVIVPLAAEHGVALEINDANVFLGKTAFDRAQQMVELGHKHGALFAVNSDAHTWIEYGRDDNARQWLRDIDAPKLDIINDWPIDRVLAHFEKRKQRRLEVVAR